MDFAADLTQRPAATAVFTNAFSSLYPALTKYKTSEETNIILN